MKRALTVVLFSVSLALASSCGGGQETSKAGPDKGDDDSEDAEVSEKGKKWGGWRWKGKRNDCFFVYKNECFSKLNKACRKAKCAKDECGHDESAPAKVSCTK